LPRPQRDRHQEPRQHRPGGLRQRGQHRLRHGASCRASEDRTDAHAQSAGCVAASPRRDCLVTILRSVVLGCGSYLPGRVLTNEELAKTVDTSDEWIVQRTGIHERRIAATGETTSEMAIEAAKTALAHAKVEADSIDLIVLATSTPDNTF